MKWLLDLLWSIALPFVLMGSGIGLVALSFEFQIAWLLWAGIALFVAGILNGLWVMMSSGVSPFGD